MAKFAKRGTFAFVIFLLITGWWWMSWDFDDAFVAGSYVEVPHGIGEHDGCNSLTLNRDHSFTQEIWHGDLYAARVTGTWRRFGEAGVAFSNTFLGATPASITSNNVYGMLDNTFGYHTLTIDSQTQPLTFHKRLITFTAACS